MGPRARANLAFNLLVGVWIQSFSKCVTVSIEGDPVIRTDEPLFDLPLKWVVSLTRCPCLEVPLLTLHYWAAETGLFIQRVPEGCPLVRLLNLPSRCCIVPPNRWPAALGWHPAPPIWQQVLICHTLFCIVLLLSHLCLLPSPTGQSPVCCRHSCVRWQGL